MKRITLLFLVNTMISFAQGEANHWYFGQNAGLDFTSGSPVPDLNGQINTLEGCAVLSNNVGQLLFYTDGKIVYNKNHQVMVNGTGLMGDTSTSQSATIIPKPGAGNLYYIITMDSRGSPNGLRYSVVDISLQGGLGEVVSSQKNILLYTPSAEKIAVVKHANNIDYWIVTHGFGNNTFYSHLLTSVGINNTPITTSIGAVIPNTDTDYSIGYMKLSPNGKKIAVCNALINAELYDFNNITGVLSNRIELLTNAGLNFFYGCEFSPNSEVLYITVDVSGNAVYQFNLNAADIPNSKINLIDPNVVFGNIGALQLGPNGKIYLSRFGKNALDVINNPNTIGIGCNLQLESVSLGGRQTQVGLPAFSQSFFFTPSIQLQNACVGESVNFSLNTNQTVLSATWDFGDGSPTVNGITASHPYMSTGSFPVSVSIVTPTGTGLNTRDITISAVPTATKPIDIKKCDGNTDGFEVFDLTTQNATILGNQTTGFTVKYYASLADITNNLPIVTPTAYTNTTAYGLQTIYAVVTNNQNTNCKSQTDFTIQVFKSPTTPAVFNDLTACDNTSFGTDVDGRVVWNLTTQNTNILFGQLASEFTIEYYTNATLTALISSPTNYINTTATQTIYYKKYNTLNPTCFVSGWFYLTVNSLPVINSNVTLKQCDDNNDGFSAFNLNEASQALVGNATGLTITFYETLADANNINATSIANTTAYTNQTVSSDVIYARVTNANSCFRTATINLSVSTTNIPVGFMRTFTVCDNGSNIRDGIATFDFSSALNDIQALYPVGQQLNIKFYQNLADALAEQNAIPNINNYQNISSPNSQNIYVRVDSQVNNDCLGLGHHVTLVVEPIPNPVDIIVNQCDDDQDGVLNFNTSNFQATLLNGQTNATVTYEELVNGNYIALSSPLPNPLSVNGYKEIRVTVTNNSAQACSFNSVIKLTVNDLPQVFPIPSSLTTVCDDEVDPVMQNGMYAFDTSNFQTTILQGQTGMTVKYFDANNNPLSSPLPNPYNTGNTTVRVEVSNNINTTCVANGMISFMVNPTPKINLVGSELICSNNPNFTKTIDAGVINVAEINTFLYQWYKDGQLINGANNYDLTVNQEGIYTVTVTNTQGCSKTRTITVTASNMSTIQNIEINDLSDNNSINIIAIGSGDYEYSIDGNIYQDSPIFFGLQSGNYTVYVRDKNGCGIAQEQISLLGIPKFFTPNGDGYNEYWNIRGISGINQESTVHIFDKYGKLLKQIAPTSQGWDGTYNGEQLPSTDYWYVINLKDGRIFKGNFTLKR